MKDNVKVVQYGCGKMSVFTMRYLIDNGYHIIGAFDINPKIIGLDIGDIIGSDKKGISVKEASEVEEFFKENKPDVCIVTTMSLLKDIKDILILCAKYGVNAITTCEEAFYPFNSSPSLTKEIDELAKKNDCTITGTGYQDASWGNLISTIVGTSHKVVKIKGSSSYNVEDYGIALAKAHGAGLTKEEFERDIASSDNISEEERNSLIQKGKFLPSYMWNVNGWLCDKLNLHVISQEQKCIPIIADVSVSSSTLNMTIEKGMVRGMSALVITKTKEGVTLETECIGKVYTKEEFDSNNWEVLGEPNTNMVINRPDTVSLTCAALVNRIDDLLRSESGFVPTSRMGELENKNLLTLKFFW